MVLMLCPNFNVMTFHKGMELDTLIGDISVWKISRFHLGVTLKMYLLKKKKNTVCRSWVQLCCLQSPLNQCHDKMGKSWKTYLIVKRK